MSSAPESVVELGTDFGPPPEPPAVPWPLLVRRARLPVLLCLLLLLCAASAVPPPPLLRPVARVVVSTDASVMIAGPYLYVLDLMNGVRAFGLDDGKLRWRQQIVELATETTMTYLDGQVVVSMSDTDASGEHTVAFDARTGTRRWTSDFGSAQVVGGALLVQALPRPPGFNYVGTPQTGSIRRIDPTTGATRWTYEGSENCSVQLTTVIVELCLNTSRLAVISLDDGRPSITRTVPLGGAVDVFDQPRTHRLEVPEFVVGRDTVVIAHAAAPRPVIDGYALSDLRPLWSDRPTDTDPLFQECGTVMCFIDGSAFDPRTGKPVPVPAEPASAHLVLLPPGSGASAPVQSFGTGLSVAIPDTPRATRVILARWSGGRLTPIDVIPGAGTQSCAQIAGYLACTTAGGHLAVWQDRG